MFRTTRKLLSQPLYGLKTNNTKQILLPQPQLLYLDFDADPPQLLLLESETVLAEFCVESELLLDFLESPEVSSLALVGAAFLRL